MGLKVLFNARELEVDLRQRGERSLANGARSMRRIANRIADLAVDYAPRDDGDIENAIKVEEGEMDGRRRKTFLVYVDPNAMTTPKEREDGSLGKPRPVSGYAALMEQGLAPYGGDDYELDESVKKRDAGHPEVGGAFMKRAFRKGIERARQDLERDIAAAFTRRDGRLVAPNARFRQLRDRGEDEE